MPVKPKLEKLIKSVYQNITIRVGWYFLFAALALYFTSDIYVFYYYTAYTQFYLAVSTPILTIYVLALIMLTSNKELHRTSDAQILKFTQSIGSVSEKLDRLSGQFQEWLDRQSRESTERVRRVKPNIEVLIKTEGWVFWNRYYLIIQNSGGKGLDLNVCATWSRINDRNRQTQVYIKPELTMTSEPMKVYLDDVGRLDPSGNITIAIEVSDIESRRYNGTKPISVQNTTPVAIDLIEANIVRM